MIRRVGKIGGRNQAEEKRGGFHYRERKAEEVKARAEQTGGRYDSYLQSNIDMFRPKQGDNNIRFLPPTWENEDHYGYEIYLHSYVGADGSSYLCPLKMKQEKCPICLASKEAKDNGEEEEARGLSPTKRVLAWILDRDEGDNPIIYSMPWTTDRDIAALCYNKKTGKVIPIDHPDKGYDVSFKRQGQGLTTKYFGTQIDRDPSPISSNEKTQDEILDFVSENPIPDILKFYDYEHLENVISGTAESKDEDLDEEEEKSTRRPSSRKSRDEDEDEEEKPRTRRARDEEEEEPKAKSRRARDEDEEEEEEKPRSRRARDEEEEERPSRRARARDEEEEEVKPRSSRRSRDEEEEEEEDKPKQRGPYRRPRDEEEEEDKPRSRRRAVEDEPEEDEVEAEEEPEEEDERPRRRASRR